MVSHLSIDRHHTQNRCQKGALSIEATCENPQQNEGNPNSPCNCQISHYLFYDILSRVRVVRRSAWVRSSLQDPVSVFPRASSVYEHSHPATLDVASGANSHTSLCAPRNYLQVNRLKETEQPKFSREHHRPSIGCYQSCRSAFLYGLTHSLE